MYFPRVNSELKIDDADVNDDVKMAWHVHKWAQQPFSRRHRRPRRVILSSLISLQESCRSRFRLSSRLFGCLKCLLLLIFRHTLEIINDHPSLVVKVAKSFCKNTKYCRAKSKFRYFLSVEFVINQSTINFKSGQSVLAIHDSPPYC